MLYSRQAFKKQKHQKTFQKSHHKLQHLNNSAWYKTNFFDGKSVTSPNENEAIYIAYKLGNALSNPSN